MNITITDTITNTAITTDADAVDADTIRAWFPDAPAAVQSVVNLGRVP